MKRILSLSVLLVLLVGMATFAGFYAQITTDPLLGTPNMVLEAGLGLWGTFTGAPDIGLGLDLYTQVGNILGAPQTNSCNSWDWGFLVSIQGTEITLDLGMDFELTQTNWPTSLFLDQWVTTATITGHPGDITEVWGAIELIYDAKGELIPGLELGIRVDIPFGAPF